MSAVLLESGVLVVIMMAFRKLCRNWISARGMYRLWLIVAPRMVPIEVIVGRKPYSLLLNLVSKGMEFIPNNNYARFDLLAISMPWYLIVLWIVGSVIVFFWIERVNFRFEKMLFECRTRVLEDACSYPVYQVSGLSSSCVFKVKGEEGIYIGKEALEDSELYRTILIHEICHLRARELFWSKLRLFLVTIYWFHPLVWIAAFLSKEDCEMACDERAVSILNTKKRVMGKTC